MISISEIHIKNLSVSRHKHVLLLKIEGQSNSLNSVRFCNISLKPGDHARFLETHGNSMRLGRSGNIAILNTGLSIIIMEYCSWLQ